MMSKFGRRTLYIWGLVALEVLLLAIGGLGFAHPDKEHQGVAWAVGSMLLIFTFIYDFTVGPVCYCLVAEISSTRLRAKTVVLSRNLYNIGGIVNNIIVPRMLNPQAWNWGAKSGLFWAGVNALLIVWCFFRLPEPKGVSRAQILAIFFGEIVREANLHRRNDRGPTGSLTYSLNTRCLRENLQALQGISSSAAAS